MSAPLPIADHMQLAPGTIVGGKYRIDGFLGAGGMGVVLSATHLELNAPVAIKIVREELAQDEQIVSRLLFEARAAARMRSAHIVRVLDVARLESGAPYIVMEQLQGWDLQTQLAERGVLSIREAVCHVLQACDGLAEAHGLGIVHRDLKPENLFLATTPEGIVLKILDFGISKDIAPTVASGHCSTLTKNGSAVGSPYYMSPEQMRASPNLDARSDIWSLGAILYELLTGKCPFEADTPARLCTKVMVENAPSLLRFSARAPEQLDAIVQRCLQKDPALRFQSVTALADELRDFVASAERSSAQPKASEAPAVEASGALTQDQPAPRKTRTALVALGAVLFAGAAEFCYLRGPAVASEWLSTRHAVAASLSQTPTAVHPTLAKISDTAPRPISTATAAALPKAPEVAPAVIAPVAAVTVPASATPTHAATGPRFYIPPAPRETAPDPPDSPEARYGL
jgi:serine/threonine protein kinase